MKNLTVKNALNACRGEFVGDSNILNEEISAVITDSRKAESGALFAAIKGANADGHDYMTSVIDAGAMLCLCERIPEGYTGSAIIVDSTVKALASIAKFYRSQFDIPVIGITGSVGKTTAKEMICSVLSQRYKVHKTTGNFNNELGVPITIFGIKDEHQIAVIEMGISDFGEMSRLGEMVRPTDAVYTIIGHSHLEFLKNRAGVLKAKSEMLDHVPDNGCIFVNGDDDLLSAMDCKQKKVTFGLDKNCDIYAEDIYTTDDGETVCTIVSSSRRINAVIPAYGAHLAYAALEGAAVGMHFGLTDDEISAGLAAYSPVGSRSRMTHTNDYTIIDDCYNSNPTSAGASIISQTMLPGRRVCILGDMLELGDESAKLHAELGELAAEAGVEVLITCGEMAQHISEGARETGKPIVTWHFADKAELEEMLPVLIRKGDCILVKASRGMHFESIVNKLAL